jgi:TfoX/Sxy family transcriptional regulator of competence genes
MAYSLILAERIRETLAHLPNVVEKTMMGGLTFMLNDKMCVGIIADELMCRIDPELQEIALSKPGARIMDFSGRPMKGYVIINESGMQSQEDFEYWINMCLDFNHRAKASKKRKRKE